MPNSKEHEEIRALYQIYIDEIRYTKQQQWNTVYLTLFAIAGILALSLGLQILSQSLTIFLIAICIVIAVFGIFLIGHYQWSLARYRYKKDRIIGTFSHRAAEIVHKEPRCRELLDHFFAKELLPFLVLFWLAILLAGILAFWVILTIN